ncbi:MAG: hypothetical protein NTZ10_01310 [Candidatus Saganbacteria bacterium]|nr:hypothetical protein [Candidatus Saganbacteria bacterium]
MGKGKSKAPPFVMLPNDLLDDANFRRLSESTKIIYIYLKKSFNTKEPFVLKLSYISMEDMISSKTMSKALKELIDNGFIEKIKQGGLFGGRTTYRLIGPHSSFYYGRQNK